MSVAEVEPAVVQAPLDEQAARELTSQIKAALSSAWHLIAKAYQGRVWVPLGYESWEAYVSAEFDGYRLRPPDAQRMDVITGLRQAGMSTRAISAATELSKSTINRELATVPDGTVGQVTGINGKNYAAANTPEQRLNAALAIAKSNGHVNQDPEPDPEHEPVGKALRVLLDDVDGYLRRSTAVRRISIDRHGKTDPNLWEYHLAGSGKAGEGTAVTAGHLADRIRECADDLRSVARKLDQAATAKRGGAR